MKKLLFGIFMLSGICGFAQGTGYWQQKVKYTMNIDVDAAANQFKGKQKLEYWNNSPDALNKVFYHLYWNAFQPGSMMDERSRRQGSVEKPGGGPDWDSRVRDRILNLKPDEIGYQKIKSLSMNGVPQKFTVHETILEVHLNKAIAPGTKVVFDMEFEAQVPLQIRRAGRDNAEGVRFSMSQWYPKIAAYDRDGWHPNPYIAREFYGVWGDFDVTINIDKSYLIAGTGYLQNPNQVGYGYEENPAQVKRPAGDKLKWHFVAPNVHDFMWAADPNYVHLKKKYRDDLTLHTFYKFDQERLKKTFEGMNDRMKTRYGTAEAYIESYKKDWEKVLEEASRALPYIEQHFGKYPYKQYSFIQGGDGGMEYAMGTLLKGSGIGTVIHEWMHSWYQQILGTDESQFPWMDEGFTSYAEDRVMDYLNKARGFVHQGAYNSYFSLARSGKEEPLTTHADHYDLNYAYSISSYSKGTVFMAQLGYIVGEKTLSKILLEYYNQWKFKSPTVNDFVRVAETVSNIELDWYQQYFVNSTKTIDYAVDSLWSDEKQTNIRLRRVGLMPMPIDVQLTFKDGSKELHYIPLDLMYGTKEIEIDTISRKDYSAWKWTNPTFTISTSKKLSDVKEVNIDPSMRLADIDRKNNLLELKW